MCVETRTHRPNDKGPDATLIFEMHWNQLVPKSTFLGRLRNFVAKAVNMRLTLSLLALGFVLPTAALATGDKASRYPFDPVCPWGRLSNGKGMIHRCITEDEARALAEGSAPDRDEDIAPEAPVEAPPKAPLPKGFDLSVGPISADQGEITLGRLNLPIDKYRQCLDDHGGLKKSSGEVVVKFLVRAERVRAEGASVESYDGVSAKAAECIAAVVDRRKVGTPSVPMTGAKLTFSLREKK